MLCIKQYINDIYLYLYSSIFSLRKKKLYVHFFFISPSFLLSNINNNKIDNIYTLKNIYMGFLI